ncbi:MAG: hypothetical protein IJ614_05755 [Prevotella sp.]|nr:hypothetical protein [Prevotella sp.]
MKKFTKSVMIAIALMAGVTTANAQDEWQDTEQWQELTADMWHAWANPDNPTHCTKAAQITGEMTPAWNTNQEIGAGACVLGAENVTFNLYADISDYQYLILSGTGGPGCRVMCNRVIDEGAWKNLVVGFNAEDSHWNADFECLVIDLNEFKTMTCTANGDGDAENVKTGDERNDDFVHLHCLKNAWGGNFPVTVSGAYLFPAKNTDGIKNVNNKISKGFGKVYNLNGMEVKNPTKGLYIQNGKKVLVK